MREEVNNNRFHADTPSLAEMQRKPVYIRQNIKAKNPRELFRNLKNTIRGSGYDITYERIDIQKDAVGNTGSVDFCITSEKTVIGKIKNIGGRYTLDFSGASDIAKYSLIGGVLLFLIGLAISGWICLIGFIAILFGIFPMLKEQGKNKIWIEGEGEEYGGQRSESRDERGMQQDQIISELSINIAGESKIDSKGIKEDIDQLTRKLDTLIE